MHLHCASEIRLMSKGDLPACDGLRGAAGWNQTMSDWQRFLDLSPHGCFVAELNGVVVGTVTTIRYGRELGWVGMLLVHAGARRQGIGEALLKAALNYFQNEQVRCVKLDATPLGQGMYRKLGFQDEWGLTRFEGRDFERCVPDDGVREFHAADLSAVVELDAKTFGVKRPELIGALCGAAMRTVIAERSGKVEGFGLLRAGMVADYLGPIVAESVDCAAELVRALMGGQGTKRKFWDVPASNPAAVRLAEDVGFVPQRTLVRMFLGEENRSGNAANYFGIADPSLG
jgi:GNAT superfamily N-acetyltransferase